MILYVKETFSRNRMYQVYLKLDVLCCIVFLEEISIFFANYFVPQDTIVVSVQVGTFVPSNPLD